MEDAKILVWLNIIDSNLAAALSCGSERAGVQEGDLDLFAGEHPTCVQDISRIDNIHDDAA